MSEREHHTEKQLRRAEIGAVASLILIILSFFVMARVQYDPRDDQEKPGGIRFRIYSDPPGASMTRVNIQGSRDHELGVTNNNVLTVQDFLKEGEEAIDNWSYKILLGKKGWSSTEITVSEAEVRSGFFPPKGQPLPELHIQSVSAFFSYLWNYRRGVGVGLLAGLVGLVGFGLKVLEGRRKRQVLLRYEADPDTDSYIGKFLHDHLVTGILGKGGYGTVYRVLDGETLDERNPMALKIISYDSFGCQNVTDPNVRSKVEEALEEAKERFMRDVGIVVESDHPNICKNIDYGREENHDWVLMPLYEKNLEALLGAGEPLSPRLVLSLARQIAEGLQYAHDRHVVHRDLKPENIMLNGEQVVIIDFGIAKPKDKATLTAAGNVMGTPKYMAPEQVVGGSERLVDQYPYGLILFELLTGRFPIQLPGDVFAILNQRLTEDVRRLRTVAPQYSEELENVIARMLERDPHKRYPTILEAYQAFEAAYLAQPTSSE